MEHEAPNHTTTITTSQGGDTPVARSRWTLKPEQILILESIFNGGMVNPPRDETIKIRKLFEKFGFVGDANVFYWFQNRRSRSRLRQRQLQARPGAGLTTSPSPSTTTTRTVVFGGRRVEGATIDRCESGVVDPSNAGSALAGYDGRDLLSSSVAYGSSVINPEYESPGIITVLINRVPTRVPRGRLDFKAMFGEEMVLVHSSGIPVPVNEFGISVDCLHHGESYYLVSG